jgi:hypothetical protein
MGADQPETCIFDGTLVLEDGYNKIEGTWETPIITAFQSVVVTYRSS